MNKVTIIVPVKNEAGNILPLVLRIHQSLSNAKIFYKVIFIDDHSSDGTFKILQKLSLKYPLQVYLKQGKPGKAYSILEAIPHCDSENVVMIDGDLQYPPEVIPQMIKQLSQHGVVVAKRQYYHDSPLRKVFSNGFKYLFGKLLFGFSCDVQSGLKAFKKAIITQVKEDQVTPWTLDVPLLLTAKDLGYSIGEVAIDFSIREHGVSKVNMLKTTWEIGSRALKMRLSQKGIYPLSPKNNSTMHGAGVIHHQKKYITHTVLNHQQSALKTFQLGQKLALILIICSLIAGLAFNWLITLQVLIALLSIIYFSDSLFSFFLISKSLHAPPELSFSKKELAQIDETKLPFYSVLCPLYKEARILPHFLKSISKMDWPKNKLDVQLLLEEDDKETIAAAKRLDLPPYVKITIVPYSQPKTKPKACNYGLSLAKGKYLVIYDAEDVPDPLQLKKAYLAFQNVSSRVVCLQAKLNYFNPHQNLLTRLFTAEYSLWFDIILAGFQSINTTIPLGGTSNHFKTKVLQQIHGWDPFNVTEDCDLGVRLFKQGYKTAIIESITLEEANSKLGNWLRQRSRWIKGYMQTFLVHNRQPWAFVKKHKWHALIFQLTIGMRITFMLINPLLWLTTLSYFIFYHLVGATIEQFYPAPVFYMAVTSLVLGNFLYLYNYMIGCAKKGHWSLIKYVFFIPFYWLMASAAAFIAFYQLLTKPYYWEKTVHGLHLKGKEVEIKTFAGVPKRLSWAWPTRLGLAWQKLAGERQLFVSGTILVLANLIANFSNFLFNAFLGRELSFEDFGEVSLFTSFLFMASIPLNALSVTISHKVGYLFGKYSRTEAKGYLNHSLSYVLVYAVLITAFWLSLIPFFRHFFHSDSVWPFLFFAPVWSIGLLTVNFSGYLKGVLSFGIIGLITIAEAVVKLLVTFLLVRAGFTDWVVLAIPLSMLAELLICVLLVLREKSDKLSLKEYKFDKAFFGTSILSGISNISFLGVDILLAKHFLTSLEAGQYSVLSLIGKITYFTGTLFLPFMIPLVARNLGARQNSRRTFNFLFGATLLLSAFSFITLGIWGDRVVPLLFGSKTSSILTYLPLYILTISLFTIIRPITHYYQAQKDYLYSVIGFLLCIVQITLVSLSQHNLNQFILMLFYSSALYFLVIFLCLIFRTYAKVFLSNLRDLHNLISFHFNRRLNFQNNSTYPRILIFNWRDTKHKWAGGAENYLHQLAKKWVQLGCEVTLFCGNDGHQSRNSLIDGVQVIRRGGFYTVYLWAFLYYLRYFRGNFDVIIDSENGMPFFTPLYSRVPKFLLIHHIHQEVFRQHLSFPFSNLAIFFESKIMPLAYRSVKIITVSQSSKQQILQMRFANDENIEIVNPGVELVPLKKLAKTPYPTFLYLGRLKPYKNVDVAISAFAQIVQHYPEARLNIAGSGESLDSLKKLTSKLGLERSVQFLGVVTEEVKARLLAQSWVMLQPSMIEGWGITVIEANSAGTPVIASDVNGLRDSVVDNKTGFLVKPQSVREFATAMKYCIEYSAIRAKLSKEAYRWSKNFSWSQSAQVFLSHIEKSAQIGKNLSLPNVAIIENRIRGFERDN